MITNFEKLLKKVLDFIKEQHIERATNCLIIELDDTINSYVVALLCKLTKIKTKYITINQSNNENLYSFDKEFKLNMSFLSWNQKFSNGIKVSDCKIFHNGLILEHFVLEENGLLVGSRCRTENNLIRNYNKFEPVDILPIGDLFKSEVYELFKYLINKNNSFSNLTENIYKNKNNILEDISDDEIEWADRQNLKNGIIVDERDPIGRAAWLLYTWPQRKIIAKIHQLEKMSRHKVELVPICELRNIFQRKENLFVR